MHEVAWHYHDLACDLFGRLGPGVLLIPGKDDLTPRVKHYFTNPMPDLVQLGSAVRKNKPELSRTLRTALSQSSLDRLDYMEDGVEFIASDSPDKRRTFDEALRDLQLWEWLIKEVIGRNRPGCRDAAITLLENRLDQVMSHHTPPHDASDLQRWKTRALAIQSEHDPLLALKKYERLTQEFSWLEEVISDAAEDLDLYIQNEIDRARGK